MTGSTHIWPNGMSYQWCTKWSEPPGILCGTVQDLCRSLKPLIKRDGLLDASMLEIAEKEPVTSPTPIEEAMLLEKDPEPQKEWATTPYPPNQLEESSELDDTIRPGVMIATPQSAQKQILLPPLGFARLLAASSGTPTWRMQTLLWEYPEGPGWI